LVFAGILSVTWLVMLPEPPPPPVAVIVITPLTKEQLIPVEQFTVKLTPSGVPPF
jgi:hypothetical protein